MIWEIKISESVNLGAIIFMKDLVSFDFVVKWGQMGPAGGGGGGGGVKTKKTTTDPGAG
jgi:hypothetical protein